MMERDVVGKWHNHTIDVTSKPAPRRGLGQHSCSLHLKCYPREIALLAGTVLSLEVSPSPYVRADKKVDPLSIDLTQRLSDLGLELPPLRPKAGNYIGYHFVGDLLFLAGQGADGWTGRAGDDMTTDQAKLAARDCMLNLLAQAQDALSGDWSRWVKPVKMLGFVACTENFTECPAVIDGASDLLIELFGDEGKHARSAIGAQALPLGFVVEIELVVQVLAAPESSEPR